MLKNIENEDKTKYDTFYSHSKAEKIISESDINDADSVIYHTISIPKYIPLAGSNYIKLTKEVDHPRKVLINIQNIDDNEYFK